MTTRVDWFSGNRCGLHVKGSRFFFFSFQVWRCHACWPKWGQPRHLSCRSLLVRIFSNTSVHECLPSKKLSKWKEVCSIENFSEKAISVFWCFVWWFLVSQFEDWTRIKFFFAAKEDQIRGPCSSRTRYEWFSACLNARRCSHRWWIPRKMIDWNKIIQPSHDRTRAIHRVNFFSKSPLNSKDLSCSKRRDDHFQQIFSGTKSDAFSLVISKLVRAYFVCQRSDRIECHWGGS